jgi:putative phosphoribosyl transferase
MWTDEARGFRDRRAAGHALAGEVARSGVLGESPDPVVVVGLARGGVEVAAEVAAALDAPLDALAVRKVGHPWQPEYGIGAVAPGGVRYLRSYDGLTEEQVAETVHAAETKAEALDASIHERVARVPVGGATCVLVDDGLATGGTMLAAVLWARAQGARHVVVAVPVGAAATVRGIEREDAVDAVVCPVTPLEFGAVGFWYEDFHQVSDEDVVSLLVRSRDGAQTTASAEIAARDAVLPADLTAPRDPVGWVVFAHGSGSSRRSPRNLQVASVLQEAGIATLLFDLLTPEEELDRRNVFDVELLAARLVAATDWLAKRPEAAELPLAYFGASTGAAAALLAAAERGDAISAVVSRGGRPDLAGPRLAEVRAPTLLVVGGADTVVLDLNRAAAALLTCEHELAVVPGATHLFEEPGAMEQVAALASSWFATHFATAGQRLSTHHE